MRELAARRQSGTRFLKKTAWALYEKKKFEMMIQEVTTFVGDLVVLFPDLQDDQRTLCKAEVRAIEDGQDLVILEELVSEDDKMLDEEVKGEMAGRGHIVTDWKVDGNSEMWAGDEGIAVEAKRGFGSRRRAFWESQ
jgi:hypothetical protein